MLFFFLQRVYGDSTLGDVRHLLLELMARDVASDAGDAMSDEVERALAPLLHAVERARWITNRTMA
jgi:hypothetical protein